MLSRNMIGKIDSWAIIFCYDQWKKEKLTIYPTVSKVINLGFKEDASNTKVEIPEYKSFLDVSNKTDFLFKNEVGIDKKVLEAFCYNYSYYVRIKNKLRYFFNI